MNKKLNIKYTFSSNEDGQNYISAFDDDRLIGFLRYKISDGKSWLYFVGVQKEYRHLKEEQIGTNLMHIFENECEKRRVWGIEGKYYPKGEEGCVVKRFYERNGYSIEREDYDLIVYKSRPTKTDLKFQVEDMDFQKFDKYFQEYLSTNETEKE